MTATTMEPLTFGPVITRAMVIADQEAARVAREEERARAMRAELTEDANERMAREAALARGEIMSYLDPVPVPTVSQVLARHFAHAEAADKARPDRGESWGYIGPQYDVQQREQVAAQRSRVQRMDPVVRRYEESRAAIRPYLAEYEQRQQRRAERELERMRRESEAFVEDCERRAQAKATPARLERDWRDTVGGMIRRTASGDVDVADDWTDEDAEAHRAEWGYGEDEVVRVCDSGFSVT